MSQIITKQQVEHVAGLANLQVSEEELELYTKQIQDVLGYVEQLDRVNVDGIKPTYQTLDGTTNVWREDEVGESLSQEEAVGGAKRTSEGYFIADSVFGKVQSSCPTSHGRSPGGRAKFKVQSFSNVEQNKSQLDPFNAVLTEVDHEIATSRPGVGSRNDEIAIGYKDLFLTKGIRSTAGSNVLRDYMPQYSSSVVELLEKAGIKTKYKLNCDAWAHGSSGENSDFGATKNPWNEEFTPGGSSSGSAAAVAAGLVDFATGTDTGGSIRLPASFCNVVGLKSTYGRLSRYGIVAMASSLDSPGFFGRTVGEVRKLFEITGKADVKDATSRSQKREVSSRGAGSCFAGQTLSQKNSRNMTIGVPKEYFDKGIDPEVKKAVTEAVETFRKNGFEIKEVSLPNSKFGIAVYYLVQTTEVASNLGRYDGIRYGNDRSYFGAEAKRRIMLGTFASSAGYSAKFFEKAARVRTLIIQDFEKAFSKVDLILAPVSPTPPFKLGEKTGDPLSMYLSDILTVPVNLAGLPALALPCGFSKDNLPIGMQLIGARWREEKLFEVGEKYQELTDWHKRRPNKYYKSYKGYINGDK